MLLVVLRGRLSLFGAGFDHQLDPHELLLDEADDGGEVVAAFDSVDVINPLVQELTEQLVFDV